MDHGKMIRMANQIATFFRTQPGEGAALKVASHINDFWEPRMRAQLLAHLGEGGEGLDDLVRDGAASIRAPAETLAR